MKEIISTQSEFVINGETRTETEGIGWVNSKVTMSIIGGYKPSASLHTRCFGVKLVKDSDGNYERPFADTAEFVESDSYVTFDAQQLIQLHAFIGSLIVDSQ